MLCRVKKKRRTLRKVSATSLYIRIVYELVSCIFLAVAVGSFLVFDEFPSHYSDNDDYRGDDDDDDVRIFVCDDRQQWRLSVAMFEG